MTLCARCRDSTGGVSNHEVPDDAGRATCPLCGDVIEQGERERPEIDLGSGEAVE